MSEGPAKLGVAVVGLGIGEQHARAFLANSHCQLLWLYDLDVTKADVLAAKLGAGAVARSFKQIVEDKEVQVVAIASYDDVHFEQVIMALKAGKHVFVEKPLCRTLEELQEIKSVWLRHKGEIKLSSNLVLRAAPAYQWLKERIDTGDFGSVYAFDADYLYGRLHKITDGWRRDVPNYSVMQGGGIHLIDLAVWFTGQRPLWVEAHGNRICTEHSEFKYNDFVAATMQCESGLIERITANFGCMHRHQHVVRLFGTEASFICDDAGPRLHSTRDPAVMGNAVMLPPLPPSKGELIGPFIAAVQQNANWNTHTQEIFDVISICNACDDALQSKTSVKVQYV